VAELVPVELGGPGLVLQLGVADVAVVLTEEMKLTKITEMVERLTIKFENKIDGI